MLLQRCRVILLTTLALGTVLLGAACLFGSDDDRDLSDFFSGNEVADNVTVAEATESVAENGLVIPPLEDLLDLSHAPRSALEAVQKYYALIAAGRFEDAYRLINLEARELITPEAFAQRHLDIWAEGTIAGFDWEVVPPPGDNVAAVEVVLRYDTIFFGEIEEQIFAPTRRQPNWVVDWSPDLIFSGLGSSGNLVHRFIEVPERGEILDRNGIAFATQGEVAVIGVSHDLITDAEAVITLFADRLELDELSVRDLVFQDVPSYFFIPIARLPYNVNPGLVHEFEQLAELGILVQRETQRTYPQGELAAHVIGFLAEVTEEELESLTVLGYQPGDLVGRDGAEAIFEEELAGERGGRLTIISPDGQVVREIALQAPVPARDVILTLDVRIQRIGEAALGEQPGAVVAMDPRTNELLALVSYPRFNPNAFIRGLTEEEFTLYFEDEHQPFVNRTSEQLYPPGSTFKVVTLAAALEVAGLAPSAKRDCPAIWTGLGEDTPLINWKEDDRGLLTLTQSLAESCNSVFYQLGTELHRQDENALPEFASAFGFGRPTGAVGLREEPGISPGPDWKRINRNDFWYTGDTVNLSIGQGFLLATPLQITNAYAALAMDGILRTPLAARSLRGADGAEEDVFASRPIGVLPLSAESLAALRHAVRQVIVSPFGTGWIPFHGTSLAVAGKSGTAEDLGEQSHALFVAYANSTDPKLVVTVVLDDGESGADEAGPIVRRILERSLLSGWLP